MEKLIILDFTTGEVDIYPIADDYEPNMDDLLKSLGHNANTCHCKLTQGIIKMNMKLDIELYKENDLYCAYIGEDNTSGYECISDTKEGCAEQVKQYIIDKLYQL